MKTFLNISIFLSLLYFLDAIKDIDFLHKEEFLVYNSNSRRLLASELTTSGEGETSSTLISTTTEDSGSTSGETESIETSVTTTKLIQTTTTTVNTTITITKNASATTSTAFFTTTPVSRLEVRVTGSVEIQISVDVFRNETFKTELTDFLKNSTFTSLKALVPDFLFFRFYVLVELNRYILRSKYLTRPY